MYGEGMRGEAECTWKKEALYGPLLLFCHTFSLLENIHFFSDLVHLATKRV